jgi:hypothetical protein
MQLKKPCRICNISNNNIPFPTPNLHTSHKAQLRNFEDRYELRLHTPDIKEGDILVYLCTETIEVFQKDVAKINDTLLLLLPIPMNVNTTAISIKQLTDGICIIMPKTTITTNVRIGMLSIED